MYNHHRYNMGLRSLDDLKTDPRITLTRTQEIGLKFYQDKKKRIPRAEVTEIVKYVAEHAARIWPGKAS